MLAERDPLQVQSWGQQIPPVGQSFAELNPNVVLQCDPNGVLVWCNPAATRWNPGLCTGRPLADLIDELADTDFSKIVSAGLTHEVEVCRDDQWLRLTFQGTAAGGYANAYGADVTRFKELVTELRRIRLIWSNWSNNGAPKPVWRMRKLLRKRNSQNPSFSPTFLMSCALRCTPSSALQVAA